MPYILDKLNITSESTNINSFLNQTSASQFINFKNVTSYHIASTNKNINSYTYYLSPMTSGSLLNEVA
jgi:hypothetical protein